MVEAGGWAKDWVFGVMLPAIGAGASGGEAAGGGLGVGASGFGAVGTGSVGAGVWELRVLSPVWGVEVSGGEAALAWLGLGLPWFTGGLLVVAVVGVVRAGLVGSGDWGSLVVAGFGAGIPGGGVVV